MARTIDFAIVIRGGAKGKLISFDLRPQQGGRFGSSDLFLDTTRYTAAVGRKQVPRKLISVSTGADGDIAPNLRAFVEFIRKTTDNRFDAIGSFSIVGSSNGCSLVLALAAELRKLGAPRLNYVGVTNVTIMPTGRIPAVPNVGDLMPIDPPTFQKLSNKTRRFSGLANPLVFDNPHMDEEKPPRVSLQAPIDADVKRCFFEKQGNHVKFGRSPRSIIPGWWWASNMFAREVHGTVDTFESREYVVSGATDFDKHVAICEGAGFNDMLREASDELAKLPD